MEVMEVIVMTMEPWGQDITTRDAACIAYFQFYNYNSINFVLEKEETSVGNNQEVSFLYCKLNSKFSIFVSCLVKTDE